MDSVKNFFGRIFQRNSELPGNLRGNDADLKNKCPPVVDNIDIDSKFHSYTYTNPKMPTETNIRGFERPDNKGMPSFIFGDMFSIMGQMFRDMEESMRDMEQLFDRGGVFNGGFEGHDAFPSSNFPPLEYDIDSSAPQKPKREANLRDQMLMVDAPLRNEDKVDVNLDELYKDNKLDLSELPFPSTSKSNQQSTDLVPTNRAGTFETFGSRTSRSSSHSFHNGKWKVQEQIVKQSTEGTEVTTRTTNENGEIESKTEFYPGNTNSESLNPFGGNDDMRRMTSLFDRFFRPRM